MTISRRVFCQATVPAAVAITHSFADTAAAEQREFRAIQFNVFGGKGFPYQRRRARQAVAQNQVSALIAAELNRYQPDLIALSESPPASVTKAIADKLGMHVARFPSPQKWPGTIMSRYPIIESQNAPLGKPVPKGLFTRHWGRAVIKLPSDSHLIVHSVHLFPTANADVRLREIDAMLGAMRPDLAGNQSVLIMGDLNHGPTTAEYRRWTAAGFVDTFAAAGQGNGATFRSDGPKWRMDYILAHGRIADHVHESRALYTGAFRLDTNDPAAFALSDHLPVLTAFNKPNGD